MVPLGLSIGLTVRMGTVIAHDPHRCKRMAVLTMSFSAFVGAVVALCLHNFQLQIIHLFSKDEQVIRECQLIWNKMCYYIWVLFVFGINGAILRALGMQWHMAAIIVLCLWCLCLPAVLWFAVGKQGGLGVQWTLLPIFYTILQVLLAASYSGALRRGVVEAKGIIKEEEEEVEKVTTEETRLL